MVECGAFFLFTSFVPSPQSERLEQAKNFWNKIDCLIQEMLIVQDVKSNLNVQTYFIRGKIYRILHEKCARTIFTHELLTYHKSSEWTQQTSKKPTCA